DRLIEERKRFRIDADDLVRVPVEGDDVVRTDRFRRREVRADYGDPALAGASFAALAQTEHPRTGARLVGQPEDQGRRTESSAFTALDTIRKDDLRNDRGDAVGTTEGDRDPA